MGVTVSSSHVVSAAPSSSGGRLLTLCPCSSVKSLSQETVLHELLQCESFPQAAALHKLPQHGCFPRGAVLQEQAPPAWVSHWVTRSASKPSPLSTGLQVLAGACSSMGSPWGQSLFQASTCSGMGSLPWATGGCLNEAVTPWGARAGALTCPGPQKSFYNACPSTPTVVVLLQCNHKITIRNSAGPSISTVNIQ